MFRINCTAPGVAAALLTLSLLTACATPPSGDDYLVYVDDDKVILQGHDPVALFEVGRITRGTSQHKSVYHGAVYLFASARNKRNFDADPSRYAPQFGAYCSMAMAMGMLEPADVSTWSIVDGRLVVQRNQKAKTMWSRDPRGNLAKADRNWPRLLGENGKTG